VPGTRNFREFESAVVEVICVAGGRSPREPALRNTAHSRIVALVDKSHIA
jgi:hypothetical protein